MSHNPAAYGDAFAADYDVRFGPIEPDGAEVRFLVEHASGGPLLELGIGTGRFALPLVAAGLEVHGIDASRAMVERLRSKPGGDRIPVTVADFRDVPAPRRDYGLVLVAFNTLLALLTQEDQLTTIRGSAARLRPGGCLVVEAFVPDLLRFDRGQTLRTQGVLADGVRLEASVHDAVRQRVDTREVTIDGGRVTTRTIAIRYVWPSELDLMARVAGLVPEARYASWGKAPFGRASTNHISVFRKLPA